MSLPVVVHTDLMAVPASLVYTAFTVFDAFVFLNPKRNVNEGLRTVARPILTFIFRRVIYFFFSRGVEMSRGGDVKLYARSSPPPLEQFLKRFPCWQVRLAHDAHRLTAGQRPTCHVMYFDGRPSHCPHL
jgi:hypothetical protein